MSLFEINYKTKITLHRETWYYGLQYEDSKGNIVWLKTDKKVLDQHHLPPQGKYQMKNPPIFFY